MAGITALRKLQLGREGTPGTYAPATTIWRGLGMIEDAMTLNFPKEQIGVLAPSDRAYISKYEGNLSLEATEATFEQLPYVLEMGIRAVNTGTPDGSGSGVVYDYLLPTTETCTQGVYTIEGGDNEQAEYMTYCHVPSFTLSGKGGESIMVSADVVGRRVATTTFTGSVSVPTVEEILFSNGYLFIDTYGAIGTTTASNTLLEATLNVKTGVYGVYSADGDLTFGFTKQTCPNITLDVKFEYNSTALAEIAAWRAMTPRAIRWLTLGSALTTAGSSYSYKTLRIDLYGKWASFKKLDEQDGNDIVEGTFQVAYNSNQAAHADIIVVNELAVLP